MAEKKFYVVWKGRKPGIYESWDDCKSQIFEFPQAKYKAFNNKIMAEEAFKGSSKNFIGKNTLKTQLSAAQLQKIGKPIKNSISVDGACSGLTGLAEYQGIYNKDGRTLFRMGPFEDGTNNIVEFLAIVHALAYCKKHNLELPIYSDSKNAISWVKDKETRTNHPKSAENKELFDLLTRSVNWLKTNHYPNKILKWETKAWGENPADFGRK